MVSSEAFRWRAPEDGEKSIWRSTATTSERKRVHGMLLGTGVSVSWDDEAPWFESTIDDVIYNVDIMSFVAAHPRQAHTYRDFSPSRRPTQVRTMAPTAPYRARAISFCGSQMSPWVPTKASPISGAST